jgi:hypothetical protein
VVQRVSHQSDDTVGGRCPGRKNDFLLYWYRDKKGVVHHGDLRQDAGEGTFLKTGHFNDPGKGDDPMKGYEVKVTPDRERNA